MKTNKQVWAGLAMLVLVSTAAAQTTQTVRGRIVDEVSKTPLVGVNVTIVGADPIQGSATDLDGNFRIEKVAVGRQTLRVSFIGYEDQLIPNVVVTAGKEVILNLALTEAVSQLNAVVVTANTRDDKTATNNDLALVSARSFNVDDTKRYAGALGDPSRMAANFAGVIGGDDSRNDIVVRGNSPTGMLWQLEGLNIPNPNHFGSLNSTGGPVSMLNNNNLDKSDFMTSAFPAQYGNATAGVFDIRLRDGNNQKSEYLAQVGFNGFELGAEGRLSKNSSGSYIVNYRYSTLGLFNTLGIEFGTGGNVPLYQDVNFKVTLPTGRGGKWSIFGLGGISEIDLLGSKADLTSNSDLYGNENQDAYPRYRTGILGVSYEQSLSSRTFMKLTTGISTTRERFSSDSLVRNASEEVVSRFLRGEAQFESTKLSWVGSFRTKFNARNSMTYGFYADANTVDLFNRDIYANVTRDSVRADVRDRSWLLQGYATWKHRFNGNWSMAAGLHSIYSTLNEQLTLEPRASLRYLIRGTQSISIGYGLHNQAQNPLTTYVQTKLPDGSYALTNRNLGFTTSHHTVLTYDWNLSDHLRIKAEAYYQRLQNVPVTQRASSYSAINEGASFAPSTADSLVNKGTGTNYGLELTVERFFHRGFYFLITGSVFNSRYAGSDGIERNSAYNTGYVANALVGKEWRVGRNKNFFSVNLKVTTIGGRYLTPIDLVASQQSGRTLFREAEAFTDRQEAYFRTDLKLAYRKEYRRSSLEIALDLQNLTNNQNVFSQTYNPRTTRIVTQYQQGFFPVPFVRYTF